MQEQPITPTPPSVNTPPAVPPPPAKKSQKKLMIISAVCMLLLIATAAGYWFLVRKKPVVAPPTTSTATVTTTPTASNLPGLQLDTKKDYGNKYANGLLPVGDKKYDTAAAKTGTVYACSAYAANFSRDQGGAGTRGPWFTNNNTQYDINKKAHILGSVVWQPSFSNTVGGDKRLIATNDLPNHTTGTFPVARTDPAYAYDRNPNTIKAQNLNYSLNANPAYGSPNCVGGEVGVMLTGVAVFNAFDAGGRDAGAWEVQDSCSGHPQKEGEYHYHTLSSCIKDVSVNTVIGFALDGFPITGPTVAKNNILTTSDLDECHGLTSQITLDGKSVTMYHYVMTEDFPYSVSCFRSTASQPPRSQ